MEKLWAMPDYSGDHLTIFNGGDETPEEVALGILSNVDLHHPGWRSIELIGARPTSELIEALGEYGAGTTTVTSVGFTYSRKIDT